MNFQSISVWCVCKLCRASFQKIEEFLKHKFEKHLIELQSIKCIILEEAKYDQDDEQYHDFTFQQTRSPPPSQNTNIDDDVAIIVPTKATLKPLPVTVKDEPHCSFNDPNPNPEDSKKIANSNNKSYSTSPSPAPATVIKTETNVIFQDNAEDSDGETANSAPVLHHPPQDPQIKQEWVEVEMEEVSSTNDDNFRNIKSETIAPDLDLDPESSDFSQSVDVNIDSNFNGHLPQPKTVLKDCHGHSDKDRRISLESSPTTKPKPKTRVTSSKVKTLINNSIFECQLCGTQFDREPEFKIHATLCLLYNKNKHKQMEPTSKETGEVKVKAPKIQSCLTTIENGRDRHRDRQENPDTDEPMIFNPYGCPTSDLKSIYFTKTKTGSIVKSKNSKTPTTGTGTGTGRGLKQRKVRQKGRLWIPPVLENPLELQYSLPCLT